MLRTLLVGTVVLATIGFVVGTSIERSNAHHETAAHVRAEGTAAAAEGASGGESTDQHAAEGGAVTSAPAEAPHVELKPVGVDIEAVPFVVLASLMSLGLAALGWWRPAWVPGLILIAVVMVGFAALDVREVAHQSDEHQNGLAALAGIIAALHLAAAVIAVTMAVRRPREPLIRRPVRRAFRPPRPQPPAGAPRRRHHAGARRPPARR